MLQGDGVRTTVFMGSVGGARAARRVHSPLVGAEVTLERDAAALLPLEAEFEHALLVMSGSVEVDGYRLPAPPLPPGRLRPRGRTR